jgi:hypothetical protein
VKTHIPRFDLHAAARTFAVALVLLFFCALAHVNADEKAESAVNKQNTFPRNFDETKVPPYRLPDILTASDGTKINSPELWEMKRRPEIVRILESNLFGRPPGTIDGFESKLVSSEKKGDTLIQQVVLTLKKGQRRLDIDLLIFLPAEANGPVPSIVAMNFKGNHTITKHPSVVAKHPRSELIGRKSRPDQLDERGAYADRFPIEDIVSRGWGLITYAREDVIVDAKTPDFAHGAFALFPGKRRPDDWGLMAAWAWSVSRVIDYVETNPVFDANRIAVKGTSRLGVASLWAGAKDARIKVTISNVAGKAGSSLLKRDFGINSREVMLVKQHRYCENFHTWAERIDEMPFDVHFTLSLVAPRPLYISHAKEDVKVGHQGVFEALKAANSVYELYGMEGLKAEMLPEVDSPVFSRVGMHLRSGKHGILPYDWTQYLVFLDKNL